MGDDNGVDPLGHGSTVWMQELDAAKPLRHAMHIDVSVAREHAEARLAAALAAGGRIVDDSSAPAAGSSPTAPATRSASPRGRMVPGRLPTTPPSDSRCEVRFVMADPPQRGAAEVLSMTAVLDQPETGLAQLKFQAADLALEPGQYAYDVTLYPPSGYSTPILKGYVDIGANTDIYDENVYTNLNITTDITVMVAGHDSVTVIIERVDGMFLVVSELIENFTVEMDAQVAAAAASAQAAMVSENEAWSYKNEMQAWLNNAGFPFWQGTQEEYDLLTKTSDILYLIVE